MNNAMSVFSENMLSTRATVSLYISLRGLTTSALDMSDILRSALVSAVSALDHLVHELVRIGLLEIAAGTRQKAKGSSKFSVSFSHVFPPHSDFSWLDSEIRQKHGWLTFQAPDKISDAIRMVSDCSLWSNVATLASIPEKDLKNKLSIIINRRNQIAHEADMEPGAYGQKWPITISDTSEAIDFIDLIGKYIYSVIN